MKEIYIKFISEKLSVRDWQVENCVDLFAEGNTIPFISRYRKEKTGGLDDVEVAEIKHWTDVFEEMEKRKTSILGVIAEQGKLTDSLKKQIEDCVVAGELEDLYLPYRPKRRTRATAAKEAGLEPLADKMYDVAVADPRSEARKYVKGDVKDVDTALSGARDIIAERLSETASVRETLRGIFRTRRIVSKATKAGKETPEGQKYKGYFDYSEPLARIAPHRLLAILRGQDEGFLTVKIDADPEKCGNKLYYDFCHERRYPSQALAAEIREAVDDSYSRLLAPSITNEILKEFKEKADIESIKVFGENLRQLLLAPPVGQKRTMAIDPGFRNGCKIVCLDAQGNLLHHEIVYPHPPQNEKVKAITSVSRMVQDYDIQAIAIGNGTASRETEDFIKRIPLPEGCKVYVVSEDGASIYSASEVAREEFPDEDVTVRGAVSIGRRLMDPLAELVKIDPKSLGVGQYQYDVDQNLLKEKLDNTVIICVNTVGVNLNTASSYLLSYVSGIGPALASSIVKYRAASGGFESRADLMSVPRLGAKAFEQCAGFLRITNAANPLDNSAVHPECYHIVDKMAADLGVSTKELVRNEKLISQIKPEKYVEGEFGLPTINDILKELAKPGLDPREAAQEFSFAEDVHEIEDLVAGMELPGIVTNITAFGAFVDIGVHENGLIHVSQMKAAGVKGPVDPSKILKLHQHVKVSVLQVDLDRKRISLRLLK
ncbi:MAG: RNA-binding transcriptional accessory protein [Bacteroidales bacterium]|nr:RNA-binding transcriptional accessory protein [Bacteroidales bacterium]